MITKSMAMLLIGAVVAGGAAAFFTDLYIQGEIAKYKAELDSQHETTQVVVPKIDIPMGETLLKEMLAVRSVPKAYIHSESIRPNEVDAVLGRKTIHPIYRGEALLLSYISNDGERFSISSLLKKGERAVSFPVDIVSSLTGMLRPGDTIDLVFTAEDVDNNDKSVSVTRPLLKNVRILATGNRIDENNQFAPDGKYQTITLVVKEDDAAKIVHAKETGDLTVFLRSQEGDESEQNYRVTLNTLLDKDKDIKHQVEIIRGGAN